MRINFYMLVRDAIDYLGPIRAARTRELYKYWLDGKIVRRPELVRAAMRLDEKKARTR